MKIACGKPLEVAYFVVDFSSEIIVFVLFSPLTFVTHVKHIKLIGGHAPNLRTSVYDDDISRHSSHGC